MVSNIGFDLSPITLVVSYLFTGGADGEHAAQLLHTSQGLLELSDEFLTFRFGPFALGDITDA